MKIHKIEKREVISPIVQRKTLRTVPKVRLEMGISDEVSAGERRLLFNNIAELAEKRITEGEDFYPIHQLDGVVFCFAYVELNYEQNREMFN